MKVGRGRRYIGSRAKDARKFPIFGRPKLSITLINDFSELLLPDFPGFIDKL